MSFLPSSSPVSLPSLFATAGGESGSDLRAGRCYALLGDDSPLLLRLRWSLLRRAVAGPCPAWLVTVSEPLAAAPADAAQLLRAPSVRVLTLRDQADGLVEAEWTQLMAELAHFGVAGPGLLLLEPGEALWTTDDAALAALLTRWRQWIEGSGLTAVLLLPQAIGRLEQLGRCADAFSGFARLRYAGSGVLWDCFHWLGTDGFAPVGVQALVDADDGGWQLGPRAPTAARYDEPAVDEARLLCLANVFSAGQPQPPGTEVVPTTAALVTALGGAVAATVLLPFDRNTTFDEVCQLVFSLRQARGARLKIVLREINVRLRYSQEVVLARLGANLVVPAEVTPSRFLSLIQMTQGQVFSRPLPARYEDALHSAMPLLEQGYRPLPAFLAAVGPALDRSRTLGIDSALIRLPLVYGLTPVDALRYLDIKRPGDIATADGEAVYVFLFACRENDVGIALERLFRLPVSELFDSEDRCLSPVNIRRQLEQLQSLPEMPDYSEALAKLRGPQLASDRQGAPAAAPRAGTRGRALAPAQRRPLVLYAKPELRAVVTDPGEPS